MDRKLLDEARVVGERHGGWDAEDLAQELVVGVLERGGALRAPGAWMERVGRNAGIDGWRREKRRVELACEMPAGAGVLDPEAVLLLRERRLMVRRAVAALPRAQRRATIARFHSELPFEEVAVRTETEVVTARTRVHRALVAMRKRLVALRAILVLPGVQASALGLALFVPASLPSSRGVAIGYVDAGPVAVPRHRLPARVMATVQEQNTKEPMPRQPTRLDATEVPAVQRFEFTDEDVLGEIEGPDWLPLTGETAARHSSLIELRQHFVPEMVKTLEDL